MSRKDYRDKRVVHYLTVNCDLSDQKASDIIGCGRTTYRKWRNRFDIERRRHWLDGRVLNYLYWQKGFSQAETAKTIGCSVTAVQNGMEDNNISSRKQKQDRFLSLCLDGNGYECFYTSGTKIRHHRLHYYAVNDVSLSDMKGMYVHHKNGVAWDNRPENYELVTPSEHRAIHNRTRHDGYEE